MSTHLREVHPKEDRTMLLAKGGGHKSTNETVKYLIEDSDHSSHF